MAMENKHIKFAIWGVGIRGTKIYEVLENDDVIGFIDNNEQLINQTYEGKKVYSYIDFRKKYKDAIIIVSMLKFDDVEEQLLRNNDYKYVILSDCPYETLSFKVSDLLSYSGYNVQRGTKIILCGITLLTFLLYNKLCDESIKVSVFTVKPKKEYIELFSHVNDLTQDENVSYFIMQKEYAELIPGDKKIYNFYDFTYTIETYYNAEIAKYKNAYIGKRCFIVATGPSLKIEDLDKLYLNKEYCFSMNKIFLSFDKTCWRPDFYVADDALVIEQNAEVIDQLNVKNMFISDAYKGKFNKNILRYHLYMKKNNEEVYFSEDLSHVCVCGCTVTYSILQFAIYMGFKEIYLLGVDFNYFGRGTVGNHFYKEEDKKNSWICLDDNLKAYMCAKEYAEKHNIKIYNATRGGKLEVFERVNFDEVTSIGNANR